MCVYSVILKEIDMSKDDLIFKSEIPTTKFCSISTNFPFLNFELNGNKII